MTRTNDTARERQLERYLLGTLAADDQDRLEEAFLADHDLFGELDAAEGILIDRYLEGDLPSEERQIFEERLLPSERVRDRVAMAGALQRLADERARRTDGEAGAGVVPISPFQNQRPVPGRSTTSWLAWAACLVLMLATGYLATLNVRLKEQFENGQAEWHAAVERALVAERAAAERADALAEAKAQTRDEHASLSQLQDELASRDVRIAELESEVGARAHPVPGLGSARSTSTVLFLALATRARHEPTALSLPVDGRLELQLDLDRIQPEGPLAAIIERNGVPVWQEENLQPESSGPETMLPLEPPKQIFFAGLYTIKITEGREDGSRVIGSYELEVGGH